MSDEKQQTIPWWILILPTLPMPIPPQIFKLPKKEREELKEFLAEKHAEAWTNAIRKAYEKKP